MPPDPSRRRMRMHTNGYLRTEHPQLELPSSSYGMEAKEMVLYDDDDDDDDSVQAEAEGTKQSTAVPVKCQQSTQWLC